MTTPSDGVLSGQEIYYKGISAPHPSFTTQRSKLCMCECMFVCLALAHGFLQRASHGHLGPLWTATLSAEHQEPCSASLTAS